jgi:hypothetical protein
MVSRSADGPAGGHSTCIELLPTCPTVKPRAVRRFIDVLMSTRAGWSRNRMPRRRIAATTGFIRPPLPGHSEPKAISRSNRKRLRERKNLRAGGLWARSGGFCKNAVTSILTSGS